MMKSSWEDVDILLVPSRESYTYSVAVICIAERDKSASVPTRFLFMIHNSKHLTTLKSKA